MTEATLHRVVLHDPEQGHEVIAKSLWPWAKQQLARGRELVVTACEMKDDLTERQRRYYWAVVLQEIADGVIVGGARYSKDAWHEYGKREFLPRKTKKVKVAGRARPVVSTVIASTNDLSVRRMGEYLERWMAFAAEHEVTISEPLPPELRGTRSRAKAMERGNVDSDGVIQEATA